MSEELTESGLIVPPGTVPADQSKELKHGIYKIQSEEGEITLPWTAAKILAPEALQQIASIMQMVLQKHNPAPKRKRRAP